MTVISGAASFAGCRMLLFAQQVDVIDVNDKPSGISLAGTTSVPENSLASTYVGQIATTDEDFNQTYTYSLQDVIPRLVLSLLSSLMERDIIVFISIFCCSSNGQQSNTQWTGAFVIDPTTGRLTVGSDDLNYEATPQFTLRIMTTDSGRPPYSYTGDVVVTIVDVNEVPTNISISGDEVSSHVVCDRV